ncbi:hypothetical protein [Paenibacillus sp. ISL-20]|uniref:hypothetical protein n=1 Tax=Paenibacillus sp. ISL-20 TaxID=2819163 RepID=UPI001BE7895F|nr:hypothetical protein [Paenibacillus sp. ISL-20]MBT2765878.1 hypothetical protein [Paenibacillus sp. ISL-20]
MTVRSTKSKMTGMAICVSAATSILLTTVEGSRPTGRKYYNFGEQEHFQALFEYKKTTAVSPAIA